MKKKKKKQFLDLADKYRGDGQVPPCPHFGTCGGCMFQDIPYDGQLSLKKDYINSLAPDLFQVDSVNGTDPMSYRNRMDFVTAFGKFGLREAGSYRFVADLTTCPLMQEKSRKVFETIKESVKEIEGYNYLKHEGYLRYVIFRQAYFTEEVMVNFVVSQKENRMEDIIASINSQVDSMSLLFNDGLADLSFGPEYLQIKKGYIEEEFDGIRFRVTPNSFFQSNSPVAKKMYSTIKEHVSGRTLDLYSGVGSISLFIADKAEQVTGIEIVDEAVESAMVNKEINNITNVDFQTADALDYLKNHSEAFDTLVVDPPRSGLHPKVVPLVNDMNVETLVYMSCNPVTFGENLQGLDTFKVESIEAFDMFPQTPHVETIAVLRKK